MNITTFCILYATNFLKMCASGYIMYSTAFLRVASVPIALGYILEVSNYFITDFQGINFVKSDNTFLKLRSLNLGLKNVLGASILSYYCMCYAGWYRHRKRISVEADNLSGKRDINIRDTNC